MDFFGNNNLSLKLFVEFLSEEQHRLFTSPEDWSSVEKNFGDSIYRDIIQLLTQIDYPAQEARDHWFKILEHRGGLQQKLGRDPGLPVAVCDYFTNIHPALKDLVFVNVHTLLQKERSALIDDLTGLHNRRYFKQVLHREIENAHRFGEPFSLLILDLDKFKDYNDTFGHQAGDRVLKEVAQVLVRNSRSIDHIIRYGGEEFVMILPRSEKTQAIMAAKRYRRAIEAHLFEGEERLPSGRLTATIGLASFPEDADDAKTVFQRADEALYRGKQVRNQVVAYYPDNRAYKRFPAAFDASYLEAGSNDNTRHKGLVHNISLGGTLVSSSRPSQPGRLLDVILRPIEGGREVRLTARVVRVNEDQDHPDAYYLGLSFTLNTNEERRALEELLREEAAPLH